MLKLTTEGLGDNTAALLHRFAIDLAVRVSAASMISLYLSSLKDLPEKLLTFLNGAGALIAGVPWLLLPDVIKARDDIEEMFKAKELLENATEFTLRRKEIADRNVIKQSQRVWIKNQMATLFATTANFAPTLSWILFHLLDDPVAYNAVEKEALALGEKKIYDLEDLDGLPVLSSVIKETIRLHSIHIPTKDILEDMEVKLGDKTYLLKKGSRLMSYTPIKHYDPYLFSNPFEFQYDRFLGNDKKFFYKDGDDARDPIAAFGGGAQLVSFCFQHI
jgi:cytochrome P450